MKSTRNGFVLGAGWPSTGRCWETPKATVAPSQPDLVKFRLECRDGGHVQGVELQREEDSKEEGRDGSECCAPARRSRPYCPKIPEGPRLPNPRVLCGPRSANAKAGEFNCRTTSCRNSGAK